MRSIMMERWNAVGFVPRLHCTSAGSRSSSPRYFVPNRTGLAYFTTDNYRPPMNELNHAASECVK